MQFSSKTTRRDALKQIFVLPALAGAMALGASALAEASDNKAVYHYQDKPGPHDRKCEQCRFFVAPDRCKIVTGAISKNGWCVAWSK